MQPLLPAPPSTLSSASRSASARVRTLGSCPPRLGSAGSVLPSLASSSDGSSANHQIVQPLASIQWINAVMEDAKRKVELMARLHPRLLDCDSGMDQQCRAHLSHLFEVERRLIQDVQHNLYSPKPSAHAHRGKRFDSPAQPLRIPSLPVQNGTNNMSISLASSSSSSVSTPPFSPPLPLPPSSSQAQLSSATPRSPRLAWGSSVSTNNTSANTSVSSTPEQNNHHLEIGRERRKAAKQNRNESLSSAISVHSSSSDVENESTLSNSDEKQRESKTAPNPNANANANTSNSNTTSLDENLPFETPRHLPHSARSDHRTISVEDSALDALRIIQSSPSLANYVDDMCPRDQLSTSTPFIDYFAALLAFLKDKLNSQFPSAESESAAASREATAMNHRSKDQIQSEFAKQFAALDVTTKNKDETHQLMLLHEKLKASKADHARLLSQKDSHIARLQVQIQALQVESAASLTKLSQSVQERYNAAEEEFDAAERAMLDQLKSLQDSFKEKSQHTFANELLLHRKAFSRQQSASDWIQKYDRDMTHKYNALQTLKAQYEAETQERLRLLDHFTKFDTERALLAWQNKVKDLEKARSDELDRRRSIAALLLQSMFRTHQYRIKEEEAAQEKAAKNKKNKDAKKKAPGSAKGKGSKK